MARQRRIQLSGASYYITASGRDGSLITIDDTDRNAFEGLLEELQSRLRWTFFAWSLLEDRYHLVLRLQMPNLVSGMTWLQNTWAKWFNTRHGRSGPLFQGRYRGLIVEEAFLPDLINLIHLSPLRAGLASLEEGLARYPWCSLRDYLLPASGGRAWISVADGLGLVGYPGADSQARLDYLEKLEKLSESPELLSHATGSLDLALKRGWCLGSAQFRQEIRAAISAEEKLPPAAGHSLSHELALRILKTGLAMEGLTRESLEGLRKSDWRKRAIGRAIRRRTAVPLEWIAANLYMGAPSRAAALTSEKPSPEWGAGWKKALDLIRALEQVGSLDPAGEGSTR